VGKKRIGQNILFGWLAGTDKPLRATGPKPLISRSSNGGSKQLIGAKTPSIYGLSNGVGGWGAVSIAKDL